MKVKQLSKEWMTKGIVSAACLLGVSIPVAALALPSQEVTRTYYSNANKTEVVGGSILSCYGGRATWGRVTRYVTVSSEPCAGGGGSRGPRVPCEFRADPTCLNLPTRY